MFTLSGREDPNYLPQSYSGSKRGGGCKKYFVSASLDRLKLLYNGLLPFVDVHIVRMGGSNNFP